MCRSKDHGGRRCPGDNADARRARRYAQAARARATQAAESSLRPTAPGGPDVGEKPSAEAISERAALLRRFMPHRRSFQKAVGEYLKELMRDTDSDEWYRLIAQKVRDLASEHGVLELTEGEDPLIQLETGTVLESRVEQMVREVGAAADVWLDGELAEQEQACVAAQERVRTARAARAEIREKLDVQVSAYHEAKRRGQDTDALKEESYRLERETVQADRRVREVLQEAKEARRSYFVRKRELIAQLRPMGGRLAWTTAGVKTPARVDEQIQKAASMLPADWIEANNRITEEQWDPHPVRVRESSRRSHYSGHKYVTVRERRPEVDMYSAYGFLSGTSLLETIPADPHMEIVPYEQWPDDYQKRYHRDESYLVQHYDVAHPDRIEVKTGRIIVDKDGNLAVSGRAASGWERHEYVDRIGDRQLCYRRKRYETTVEKKEGFAEITLPKGVSESSVALHELVHRCEDVNRSIGSLESAFYERRTCGEDGFPMPDEALHPKLKDERVRPDSFVDRYIGKDYGNDRYFEVMSMGSEMALYGEHGGFGKAGEGDERLRDDDHHAFVLGVLLSV